MSDTGQEVGWKVELRLTPHVSKLVVDVYIFGDVFCIGYPDVRGMAEVCCTRETSNMERLRLLIKQVLDK